VSSPVASQHHARAYKFCGPVEADDMMRAHDKLLVCLISGCKHVLASVVDQ
jgi:hypothetical protein